MCNKSGRGIPQRKNPVLLETVPGTSSAPWRPSCGPRELRHDCDPGFYQVTVASSRGVFYFTSARGRPLTPRFRGKRTCLLSPVMESGSSGRSFRSAERSLPSPTPRPNGSRTRGLKCLLFLWLIHYSHARACACLLARFVR